MSKKVQVDFKDDTIATLDEIAGTLRRKRNNYKLGVATVVAEIIEGIISSRPELIHELLSAKTQHLLVTAEQKPEHQARPKAQTARQGKKQAAS